MSTTLALRVAHTEPLTPRIRRLLLAPEGDRPLPAYDAGAHLQLHVPSAAGGVMHRAYSLVRPGADQALLEIAVQLEAPGQGGSRWVHGLKPGDTLRADAPTNHFPLRGAQHRPLLLAAGIGITPILCMALQLQQRALAFDLHYVARSAEQAAYVDEVRALPGAHCWFDGGDPGRGIPLAQVIGAPVAGRHLQVCGPKPFIQAVLSAAQALGWAEDALHCELFTGTLDHAADRAFTVELRASGCTLPVPVGTTVLEAMEAAGLDPVFDCRRGDCGVCVARVLGGEPVHQDICLSARERSEGSFCVCVSRARSAHLVLDL